MHQFCVVIFVQFVVTGDNLLQTLVIENPIPTNIIINSSMNARRTQPSSSTEELHRGLRPISHQIQRMGQALKRGFPGHSVIKQMSAQLMMLTLPATDYVPQRVQLVVVDTTKKKGIRRKQFNMLTKSVNFSIS